MSALTKMMVVTTAVLGILPPLALAASHDLRTFISEYDLDRNGSVSKEEFAKERERRFAATDADRDGGVSQDEYVGEYRARLEAKKPAAERFEKQMKQAVTRFGILDSNRDGKISTAEYQYSGWAAFREHDYSKDGAVSLADEVGEQARKEV